MSTSSIVLFISTGGHGITQCWLEHRRTGDYPFHFAGVFTLSAEDGLMYAYEDANVATRISRLHGFPPECLTAIRIEFTQEVFSRLQSEDKIRRPRGASNGVWQIRSECLQSLRDDEAAFSVATMTGHQSIALDEMGFSEDALMVLKHARCDSVQALLGIMMRSPEPLEQMLKELGVEDLEQFYERFAAKMEQMQPLEECEIAEVIYIPSMAAEVEVLLANGQQGAHMEKLFGPILERRRAAQRAENDAVEPPAEQVVDSPAGN